MIRKMNTVGVFMLYLTSVYCQGQPAPPPPSPPGEPKEDCVLLLDPMIRVRDDEKSHAFASTDLLETVQINENTTIVNGTIYFYKEIPNKPIKVTVTVEKEKSGRREMVFSHEINDMCKEMVNPESDYHGYFKFMEFAKECPVKPGAYIVKEMVADTSDMPVNCANEGTYGVTMEMFSEDSLLAAFQIGCIIG